MEAEIKDSYILNLIRSKSKRFWSNVEKNENKCWTWNGKLFQNGYGYFQIQDNLKINYFIAHRISYMLINNVFLNRSQLVCHKCDNKKCVNPNHLFLGTQKDNVQDMMSKNRNNPAKGSKNGKAKINETNVIKIKNLLSKNNLTQKQIAKIFHITSKMVTDINTERTWRHLTSV